MDDNYQRCPKCERDITDSHQPGEHGLYPSHWYCEKCDLAILDRDKGSGVMECLVTY